jgi:hypothetical protein
MTAINFVKKLKTDAIKIHKDYKLAAFYRWCELGILNQKDCFNYSEEIEQILTKQKKNF